MGGLKSSVVEDREGDVDENLKNGPGAAAKKRRASPEIHGPCPGQQQYNAALSPGDLMYPAETISVSPVYATPPAQEPKRLHVGTPEGAKNGQKLSSQKQISDTSHPKA